MNELNWDAMDFEYDHALNLLFGKQTPEGYPTAACVIEYQSEIPALEKKSNVFGKEIRSEVLRAQLFSQAVTKADFENTLLFDDDGYYLLVTTPQAVDKLKQAQLDYKQVFNAPYDQLFEDVLSGRGGVLVQPFAPHFDDQQLQIINEKVPFDPPIVMQRISPSSEPFLMITQEQMHILSADWKQAQQFQRRLAEEAAKPSQAKAEAPLPPEVAKAIRRLIGRHADMKTTGEVQLRLPLSEETLPDKDTATQRVTKRYDAASADLLGNIYDTIKRAWDEQSESVTFPLLDMSGLTDSLQDVHLSKKNRLAIVMSAEKPLDVIVEQIRRSEYKVSWQVSADDTLKQAIKSINEYFEFTQPITLEEVDGKTHISLSMKDLFELSRIQNQLDANRQPDNTVDGVQPDEKVVPFPPKIPNGRGGGQ